MSLNSLAYLAFLGIVLTLYYLLPRRAQNPLLLAASYLFYGTWDLRFLAVLVALTALVFICGRAIGVAQRPGARKLWLAVGVAGALGALGFFKYANFFLENTQRLLGFLGLPAHVPTLYLLLPVGISFYVFQAISYTVDVYRGTVLPAGRPLDFALYMAYFPKVVAGPIERAGSFLPQFDAPRTLRPEQLRAGLALLLLGLFKKVAIADPLSTFIDPLFARPDLFSTPELLRAALFFTLQIYCDFSGYTDIARGASRLFGIELTENFAQPYLATNLRDFWRRWHISLSSWLRDYLYIPLGGNRKGRLRTYVNLLATMLLGGLWHGASWNFVAWGGLHGAGLAVHRLVTGDRAAAPSRGVLAFALRALSWLGTIAFVTLAWVFFRAWGARAAVDFLSHLASLRGLEQFPPLLLSIAVPWLPVLALDGLQRRAGDQLFFLRWPVAARAALYAGLVVAIVLGSGIRAPFIYSQF